ncbi:MAG: hypothetical protein U0X76_09510 [Bacteroidia bacterium]
MKIKFSHDGKAEKKELSKFHKGMEDSTATGLQFRNICPHKTTIITGIVNKAAGWGDLKNRIIGAKNRQF